MRFVMFSLTIIFACLAMTALNTIDDAYMLETNTSLFGWQATPFLTQDDLHYVGTIDGMQEAVGDVTDTKTVPKSFVGELVDIGWNTVVTAYNGLRFILETLYNTTLNVGPFLNTLGRTDFQMFPDHIATTFTIGINIVYLLGIIQLYTRRNLKEVA